MKCANSQSAKLGNCSTCGMSLEKKSWPHPEDRCGRGPPAFLRKSFDYKILQL